MFAHADALRLYRPLIPPAYRPFRDLKLENIMLCPSGTGTIAKLVDFGLHKVIDDRIKKVRRCAFWTVGWLDLLLSRLSCFEPVAVCVSIILNSVV